MGFWLSSQNVFDYLNKQGLALETERSQIQIDQTVAKNFNLIATLPDGRKLLVKQERYSPDGKRGEEFLGEWQIQELLRRFPAFSQLSSHLPQVLAFDQENSIIVYHYLTDYQDLANSYRTERTFPADIAAAIATLLAKLHRSTLDQSNYRDLFSQTGGVPAGHPLNVMVKLERLGPEIFGAVPTDGLKFFSLYQCYEQLPGAIAQLVAEFESCCLTHNDLKLNNILLHDRWAQRLAGEAGAVRLIDWERCAWGDPAFDLGMLIGSYLSLWLNSLVVSKTMALEDSLRLAITPLEQLQPSTEALMTTYLQQFPEIRARCPQFLTRSVQFAGVALILQIQATLQHAKVFGNTGICSLQVAKGLLCRPEQSIPTVFGRSASELMGLQPAFV